MLMIKKCTQESLMCKINYEYVHTLAAISKSAIKLFIVQPPLSCTESAWGRQSAGFDLIKDLFKGINLQAVT